MEYIQGIIAVVVIDLLLSGDNALVIALASRQLAPAQRRAAIFWGCAGAVSLRVALAVAAVPLLGLPYLKLAGGLLLLWIAIKLAVADHDMAGEDIKAADNLAGAVKTILAADFIMSLDNVVAIVAVSKGSIPLLIAGLAISIPIIIYGSKAITVLIARWPVVIIAGAVFLGWTAGEMCIADQKILPYLATLSPHIHWLVPGVFALLVLVADFLLAGRRLRKPRY